MNELSKLSLKLFTQIMAKSGYEMSSAEFKEQKKSFVVGNSFDAFDGPEQITRTSLEKLELKRRLTAS